MFPHYQHRHCWPAFLLFFGKTWNKRRIFLVDEFRTWEICSTACSRVEKDIGWLLGQKIETLLFYFILFILFFRTWRKFISVYLMKLYFFFGFLFVCFPFIFISWKLITLKCYSCFCHTLTWISHGFTCVPILNPPPHPIPLGHPSAPAPSTCLVHPTWTGDLFHTW